MNSFNYAEINLIGIGILLVICMNIQCISKKYVFEQKIFMALIISDTMILAADTAMWMMDGKSGLIFRMAYLFMTVVYYILNPIPCALWLFYSDFKIHRNKRRLQIILKFAVLPVVINAVLAIAGTLSNFLFYIDKHNIYHRGRLFIVVPLICYGYLVYTMINTIKNKNKLKREEYYSMIMFPFLPLVGSIVQAFFYGVSLIWICMAFSLLIIFVTIQNNELYTDHLTGLFNRRQLDSYLAEQQDKNDIGDKFLAGIMIDVNSFKEINDVHGHAAGDEALEYVGRLLRMSFKKDDFISRYGGDEFIVMMEIAEKSEVLHRINSLKKNIYSFNLKRVTPYSLSLSIGYDVWDSKSGMTAPQFLKHIDNLMYKDKKESKSLR